MKLNLEQQKKVETNMGLVGKVIKDKVRNINSIPGYTYDDLFQIGCIGLSKAAATDKGGTFSTYACRLIWNEICDALAYSTRKYSKEDSTDYVCLKYDYNSSKTQGNTKFELYDVLKSAKSNVSPSVALGIDAMLLMSNGYTAKDIGARFGKTTNTITALVSKAKKYLRSLHEFNITYGEA